MARHLHRTLCVLPLLLLSSLAPLGETVPVSSNCSWSPDLKHDLPPGLLVNCSSRGYFTIPWDLPPNTTTLLLASNRLRTVPDDAFLSLQDLRQLDLSDNHISSLQQYAFRGLSGLTTLSLWDNSLKLCPHTYPSRLFEPLVSLHTLILSRNSRRLSARERATADQGVSDGPAVDSVLAPPGKSLKFQTVNAEKRDVALSLGQDAQRTGSLQKTSQRGAQLTSFTNTFDVRDDQIQHTDLDYPGNSLSHLVNLRYLSMDGLTNKSLGPGFRNLTQLTHLDLNGKTGLCSLFTLDRNTFSNLPSLTHLNLSDCGIRNLTGDAFMFMQNLTDLDLSSNTALGFDMLGGAFHGLSMTRLTNLTIDFIGDRKSFGTVLTSSQLTYFRELRHLERLQARFNRLQGVEPGVLCHGMPPNLKYINADGNLWQLAPYINDLHCLKSLEQLDVNGMDELWTPPLRPPDAATKPPTSGQATQVMNEQFRAEESTTQTTASSLQAKKARSSCELFKVPPLLESFSTRNMGLNYKLEKVGISSENSLKKLDLSQNYLPVWHGPLCGFHNVTQLFLMDTFAEHVNVQFFNGFPALRTLNISRNRLRHVFSGDRNGQIFHRLKNLQTLDMSYNNLGPLNKKILLPLENLEELYLPVNGMANFSLLLTHMKKLRHLDISKNQFHTIPRETRDHLDMLAERFNVSVDMTFNPILCTCYNIDFLRWVRESKVQFGTEENYYCQYSDGSVEEMHDLMVTIADLEQKCGSYVGLFVGTFGSLVIFLSMMIVALGYRFRWKLRYLYYASRLSVQRRQNQVEEFSFDAFVSFSSEDAHFVEGELRRQLEDVHGLRLCIHTRDFTPGHYIASSIVGSVQSSRRTLVVLTRSLLASNWCHYELQMALMEGSHSARDVLLFLLYEHVPASELSRELLANLQANVYIEFPRGEEDEENKELFWARLAQALRE
ncbi:toll-like receptor 4 [Babylonia areolata]|uniref:toll-like receptor 4 n=1 Tax=Babylonia areolata TaxID=304850 RepID=UPI003FD57244